MKISRYKKAGVAGLIGIAGTSTGCFDVAMWAGSQAMAERRHDELERRIEILTDQQRRTNRLLEMDRMRKEQIANGSYIDEEDLEVEYRLRTGEGIYP